MEDIRSKSWFKRSDALIAAFVVPVIIMIIIFVQREIFPFGDRSFLCTDMYHQYAPFFSEFQYKLQNGRSLLYSWNIGLGTNFSALFAYYLSSPFNWLLYFIPNAYVIEFMTYLIVLKTGLAGVSMSAYLNKHADNSHFAAAFFGILYALSGYLVAYSWNIMWLDCIVLFPLIILGLEKLVEEKRGLLYVVTLGVCILTNYYISIMVCIALCMYFVMLLIVKGVKSFKSFLASVGLFAGYSLLAGALGAVVLLPSLFAMQAAASGNITFPQVTVQYFSIIDMLARHMINVKTEQVLDHWPNIYCGVAVFVLGLLYLMNRRIKLKEKAVYMTALVFLLASFSLNVLSFCWHGLHYPNSLPARQSFIYIFLMLFICFRAVDHLEGNTIKDIGIATVVSLGFILLCQKVVTDDAFTWSVFYISMGFVALYGLLLYLYRSGKININVLTFLIIAVVAVEAAINTTTTGVTTILRDSYTADNAAVQACIRAVGDDTDFYRIEKETRRTKDDGAWYHMPTVSLFSSTAKAGLSEFFEDIGCEASMNSYSITGSTPLVDALLGVKYSITTGMSADTDKTLIAGLDETFIYQNKYCLAPGYMLPENIGNLWDLDAKQPAFVQNEFCDILTVPQVMQRVDGFRSGSIYSTTIAEDGRYYAFSENDSTGKMEVTINGAEKKFENLTRGYLMELGYLHQNDTVDFETTDDTTTQVGVYRFDMEALGQLVEKLDAQSLQVESFDDRHLNGSIDVAERGILMLSIPYEKGWTVLVDGKKCEPEELWNAFPGIRLEAGHHDIRMTYEPEGFRIGWMVSAGAAGVILIIAIIYLIITIVKRKKQEASDETDEEGGSDPVGFAAPDGGSGNSADSEEPLREISKADVPFEFSAEGDASAAEPESKAGSEEQRPADPY